MAPRMRSFCKKRVESQVSSQGKLCVVGYSVIGGGLRPRAGFTRLAVRRRILHTKDKSQVVVD